MRLLFRTNEGEELDRTGTVRSEQYLKTHAQSSIAFAYLAVDAERF